MGSINGRGKRYTSSCPLDRRLTRIKFFGPNWQSPSPTILHIGNPEPSPSSTPNNLCPVWKKSNELFGKVFSYHSTGSLTRTSSETAEAGLLYLSIKSGWNKTDQWMQSPVLQILKQVDDLLFCHLPDLQRLAVAYKSFKLLKVRPEQYPKNLTDANLRKYYLNATKEELDKVPEWLRPRYIYYHSAF